MSSNRPVLPPLSPDDALIVADMLASLKPEDRPWNDHTIDSIEATLRDYARLSTDEIDTIERLRDLPNAPCDWVSPKGGHCGLMPLHWLHRERTRGHSYRTRVELIWTWLEGRDAEATRLRKLILQFIGSLTLCDHMGDVSNDVTEVLERLGIETEWNEWEDLGQALDRMGITTLQGTSLAGEEE